MISNQRLELAKVIPSIGARIALQNYFNYDLKKEVKASPEISVTPILTPPVTSTLTLAITPQDVRPSSNSTVRNVRLSNSSTS